MKLRYINSRAMNLHSGSLALRKSIFYTALQIIYSCMVAGRHKVDSQEVSFNSLSVPKGDES